MNNNNCTELICDENGVVNKRKKFYERWNINAKIENKNKIKTRCLSVISKLLNDINNSYSDNIRYFRYNFLEDYCYEISAILGISFESNSFSKFEKKDLYYYLQKLDLSDEDNYHTFIWYLELTLNYKPIDGDYKDELIKRIVDALKLSGCNIRIIKNKDDYEIYPNDVDFLDEPLIYDLLNWLDGYKEVKKHFSEAIKAIRTNENLRYIADELRLSLELLFKKLFNNDKSLENQKNNIGNYLKESKISTEISNMYVKLIDLYSIYNNQNAKHNDKVNEYEIDYLIYLTGSFIRFIVQLEQSKYEMKGE